MTDDSTLKQTPENIKITSDSPPIEKEEDWAMRNKIIIWIIAFFVLKFVFEYMGWLHH